MKDNYLISGIPPSNGGVGRLVSFLEYYIEKKSIPINLIYTSLSYQWVNKEKYGFFIDILKKLKIIKIIRKVIRFLKFNKKIKNSKILLLHPQTIGFKKTIELIRNNEVYLYIMDNSFFCLKSYNYLNGEVCLKCLESNNFKEAIESKCKSFPVNYSIKENINFLINLKKYSDKIIFLVQNKNQKKLVEKHFKTSNIKIVGMYTKELEISEITNNNKIFKYDFVYHGNYLPEKGFFYVFELSKYLKNESFLIPYSKAFILKKYPNLNIDEYKNIDFIDINWDNGLKDYVIQSKINLTPSIWSAPIEGAFMKSIIYNGCVASFRSKYSYAEELDDKIFITLEGNPKIDSYNLKSILNNENLRQEYINNSQEFIKKYISQREKNLDKIFINFKVK